MNVPYGNCIRNALPGQLRISWRKCEVVDISFVIYCLTKLLFCYSAYMRPCERSWATKADERCWFGGTFERALANLAILNQIIFLIVHKHLIAI